MVPTYKPQIEVVLHNGDKVAVAELTFPSALEFLRKIGEVGREHLATRMGDKSVTVSPQDFLDQLPELVLKFNELSGFLLHESVVQPEGAPDPLLGRGMSDFLRLLNAAFEINTSPNVVAAVEALTKNVKDAMTRLRPGMATGTAPALPA
jgi:hypothetical protein